VNDVRCCSDTEKSGYQQINDCTVWAQAEFHIADGVGVCIRDANLQLARETCAEDGARLCTVAEVEGSCTSVGCGSDEAVSNSVWTSESCQGDSGTTCDHDRLGGSGEHQNKSAGLSLGVPVVLGSLLE
jgi:hypothetical protein